MVLRAGLRYWRKRHQRFLASFRYWYCRIVLCLPSLSSIKILTAIEAGRGCNAGGVAGEDFDSGVDLVEWL